MNKEEFKLNIVNKLKAHHPGLLKLFLEESKNGRRADTTYKLKHTLICREFNLGLTFNQIQKDKEIDYVVEFEDISLDESVWRLYSEIDLSHKDCYKRMCMEWVEVLPASIILGVVGFQVVRNDQYDFEIAYDEMFDTLTVSLKNKKPNRVDIEAKIQEWKKKQFATHVYVSWFLSEYVEKKLLDWMDSTWSLTGKQSFEYERVKAFFNACIDVESDNVDTTMMKLARQLIVKEG